MEKQTSDLMENLNAQTNLNTQLKSQYTNLLKINNSLEKTNDDLREKHNNLLIQKDLIENDLNNLKNSLDNEKSSNIQLINRINELDSNIQTISIENNKLKDKENFNMNEITKLKSLLSQLEKEKSNLEFQLKNIEQNINQNELETGSTNGVGSSSDLVNEISKKFNIERKARHLAEEKTIDLEKSIQILNSDIKYLKDDLNKKEKDFNEKITELINVKKELENDLLRKNQDMNDLNSEISNLKIKEKHFTKICSDLKEETSNLKDECDRLRKISLDTENTKIKKLQEEIDELKTINQLYRSQRLESDEELNNYAREKEKLKSDYLQIKKELENLSIKFEMQKQKVESEYSARCLAEQRCLNMEQALGLQEQKSEENFRKNSTELENVCLYSKLIFILILINNLFKI